MKVILSLMAIFFLSSCQFGRLIGIEPRTPSVKLQTVAVSGIDGSDISLELAFRIANPNFFGAKLEKVKYQLSFQDTVLAEGFSETVLTIDGEESKVFNMPLKIFGASAAGLIKSVVQSGKLPQFKYLLTGNVVTVFGDLDLERDGNWSP